MNQFEIFGSPNLLAYLAEQLVYPSCTITKDDISSFLHSSDIDLILSYSGNLSEKGIDGLLAVLSLIAISSNTVSYDVATCIHGLLAILNGAIKLKYGVSDGLTTYFSKASQPITFGRIKQDKGIQITKSVSTLTKIQFPLEHFQNADKQSPTLRNIWSIARHNTSVARTLYHYCNQEVTVNLRKVVEEIMFDTYSRPKKQTESIKFPRWLQQNWAEPEVGKDKMERLWAWLHNSQLSGDKALHSEPFANKTQTTEMNRFASITYSEITEIIRILLVKWISQKYEINCPSV